MPGTIRGIVYGKSTLRPDLELEITTDALHYILTGQLRFRRRWEGCKTSRASLEAFVLRIFLNTSRFFTSLVLREYGIDPPHKDWYLIQAITRPLAS
jgi:hypothetical protein